MNSHLLFLFIACSSFLLGENSKDILAKMTLEEKIGQLFVIPACPDRNDEKHQQNLQKMIKDYHIGSVILKKGNPCEYCHMMQTLQDLATLPLFFMVDAEWGLGMRMNDTLSFPKNLTLGAIQDNEWIYLLGKEIGRECRALGVHINLAPVVDINSNPKNPIINMRSFGENRENVAAKSIAYMKGMQDMRILACAKHFPGHGDTEQDSHLNLPMITHTKERLNAIELYPFKKIVEQNIDCVMSGHLLVPALSKFPATLSKDILTNLLRNELQFKGIIISDALNMKGLTLNYSIEQIALMAFKAGNNLLLYGDHIAPNVDRILTHDIPLAFDTIKKAYLDYIISEEELNNCVFKILEAKEQLLPPTHEELTTRSALNLKEELYKQAITLVKDEKSLLPLDPNLKIALIAEENTVFEKTLCQMIHVDHFSLLTDPKQLKKYATVIVALKEIHVNQKNLLEGNSNTILVYFGSPYSLEFFKNYGTKIVAYENDEIAQEVAAKLALGKFPFLGKLPIRYIND